MTDGPDTDHTRPPRTWPAPMARLVNSTRYSVQGLGYMFRNESAARYELVLFIASLGIYAALGAKFYIYTIALVLFLLTLAMEALNTAIEVIINRISPEISDTGKHAKDLGSAAVFCLMIINLVFFTGVVFHALR